MTPEQRLADTKYTVNFMGGYAPLRKLWGFPIWFGFGPKFRWGIPLTFDTREEAEKFLDRHREDTY